VNWRSAGAVARLAASAASGVRGPYELVIVNNDPSERAALADIVASHPNCRSLEVGRNSGFAAACNRGARETTSAWLVFVNPDTYIHELAETTLIACATRCGPRVLVGTLLLADGRVARGSVRRLPTRRRALVDSLGLDRLVPALRGAGLHYRDEERLPPFTPIEQPIGAFLAISRPLFDELGGFDERFFVFFEEVDLALRAHTAGAAVVLAPDLRIEHTGGHSTRGDRTIAIGLRWRSLRAFHGKYRTHGRVPAPGLLIMIEATRFTLQRVLPGVGFRFSLVRALRIAAGRPDPGI
jgi:hypothetical protein